jgi:hypothetical protein
MGQHTALRRSRIEQKGNMGSKASDLHEFREIQSRKMRGSRCSVGLHMSVVAAEERDALISALGNLTIDATTISVWLGRKGYKVARHTVARHRRGECQCK